TVGQGAILLENGLISQGPTGVLINRGTLDVGNFFGTRASFTIGGTLVLAGTDSVDGTPADVSAESTPITPTTPPSIAQNEQMKQVAENVDLVAEIVEKVAENVKN